VRAWKFDWEGEPATPVSAPAPAVDGRVFFAANRGSDVYLVAVSPEGRLLWEEPIPRDRFRQGFVGANRFDWLALNPEEDLVFLSGDVYRAETGEWVDFDLEAAVAEIETRLDSEDAWTTGFGDVDVWPRRVFPGPDGRVIMVAHQLLIEWQPVSGGFEMSGFVPIRGAYPVTGWYPPAYVSGDEVVLITADPNEGDGAPRLAWNTRGWFLIWNDLSNQASGETQVQDGDYLSGLDPATGTVHICRASRDPASLTCDRWAPGADETDHLFTVTGIRSIKFLELDPAAGRVYIFGKDNVLYVADIGDALEVTP
jgi:hypothetical protein